MRNATIEGHVSKGSSDPPASNWSSTDNLVSSAFVYTNATGSYYASYSLNRWIEVRSYARRRVSYGIQASQFLESSLGGGVNLQVNPRILLSLNAETGTNRYEAPSSGTGIARTDRINSYTGGLSANVYRKMVVSVNASQIEYRSPDPQFNRKVFRVTSGIGFQGLFTK